MRVNLRNPQGLGRYNSGVEHYNYNKQDFGPLVWQEFLHPLHQHRFLEWTKRSPRVLLGQESELNVLAQTCRRGNSKGVRRLLQSGNSPTSAYKPQPPVRSPSSPFSSPPRRAKTKPSPLSMPAPPSPGQTTESPATAEAVSINEIGQALRGDEADPEPKVVPVKRYSLTVLQVATLGYFTALPVPARHGYLQIISDLIAHGANLYTGTIERVDEPHRDHQTAQGHADHASVRPRPRFVMVNPSPYYLMKRHIAMGRREVIEAVVEGARILGENLKEAISVEFHVDIVIHRILEFTIGGILSDEL